jgi:hypothetical protein
MPYHLHQKPACYGSIIVHTSGVDWGVLTGQTAIVRAAWKQAYVAHSAIWMQTCALFMEGVTLTTALGERQER